MTLDASLTRESYIHDRVDYKIEAYRKKGEWYRWGHLSMSTVATVCAATVPVLINLDILSIFPTLVSLLVTILVGLEALFHFREHWRNYDLMKSYLRQEKNLFLAFAGPYRLVNEATLDDLFRIFVERVEAEIARERSETIEMRTTRRVESASRPDESQRNLIEKK